MPVQFTYMVQQPDGSVSTLQSEAARAPTWGELQDHVTSSGAQLLPATPAAQPAAEQLSAPPPSRLPPATAFISNPPAMGGAGRTWEEGAPSLAERAENVVLPHRSFESQLPSAGAAVLGSEVGAGLGMLGGPVSWLTIPAGAVVGGGLASGGTEAAQIGAERLFGWQPAEPGTFLQRVGNAALRGGVFEAIPTVAKLGWPYAAAPALRAAGWLARLPRAAEVAAPELPLLPALSNTAQRVASQAVGATPIWPGATTALGPPPPGYTPAR